MMKQLLLLLSIVLVLGCASQAVVMKGDHIAVDYTGRFENGTIFDSSVGRGPLEFAVGAGQLIKGFDAAVIGMHLNEEKNVTIAPQDAYGSYDFNKVITVPISAVPNNTKAGDVLYSSNQQFRVLEVRNDSAVLDGNHPLAGKTLIFRIRILSINSTTSS